MAGGTRADYALCDRRGRPLAVLEAKRTSVNLVAGRKQALDYAEALGVAFVFLSNGEQVMFMELASTRMRARWRRSSRRRISSGRRLPAFIAVIRRRCLSTARSRGARGRAAASLETRSLAKLSPLSTIAHGHLVNSDGLKRTRHSLPEI